MNRSRQRQEYLNYVRNSYEKREDYINRLRRGDPGLGVGIPQLDATSRPQGQGRGTLQSLKDVWNRLVSRKDSGQDV